MTGLTDGDIFRLDTFEGSEYKRIKVRVELVEEAGKFVEASTYLYTAGEEFLEKEEWSYEEFRRDKMHRWAADSYEYQGGNYWHSPDRWQRLIETEVDDAVEEDPSENDENIEHDPTGGRGVKAEQRAENGTKTEEEQEEEKALEAAV